MSWDPGTVADQKPALAVLTRIAANFDELPGAVFNATYVYPEQVTISVHEDLAHFEMWRTALGIEAGEVAYRTQPGSTVLTAKIKWHEGVVELIGYGPLPVRDVERGEPS